MTSPTPWMTSEPRSGLVLVGTVVMMVDDGGIVIEVVVTVDVVEVVGLRAASAIPSGRPSSTTRKAANPNRRPPTSTRSARDIASRRTGRHCGSEAASRLVNPVPGFEPHGTVGQATRLRV